MYATVVDLEDFDDNFSLDTNRSFEDSILDRIDAIAAVEKLLKGLSERDRNVVLFLSEGWKPAEIAEKLGITRQAVYKIRAKLRESLQFSENMI